MYAQHDIDTRICRCLAMIFIGNVYQIDPVGNCHHNIAVTCFTCSSLYKYSYGAGPEQPDYLFQDGVHRLCVCVQHIALSYKDVKNGMQNFIRVKTTLALN